MRFLWPELLWLLLVLPVLLAAYVLLLRRRKKVAVRYASLMLLRAAVGPRQRLRRHVPPALFLLAVGAAIVALARPSASITLPSEYMTIAMAVDVSRSMKETDVEPSRIEAAQAAVRSFVHDLPANVRVGFVTFAGSAQVVQTPTEVREDMLAAVDRFTLQRGTATGSGLIVALSMLLPDEGINLDWFNERYYGPRPRAKALGAEPDGPVERPPPAPVAPGSVTSSAIILLSDGRRTTGPDPVEVAKLVAERGIRVYTVGFGTMLEGATGSGNEYSIYLRLDEEALRAVAKATGGEYFHAGTAADLRKVYESLNARLVLERKETEITFLFAAAAAALLLASALLSLLWFNRSV